MNNEIKVYNSVEEWKAEGHRRFGDNILDFKFKCPMCGHVASVQDFKDLGVDDPANCAYSECIGRYTGKGSPNDADSLGCNWCSYGFLGIPKGGVIVIDDQGEKSYIYDYADVEES